MMLHYGNFKVKRYNEIMITKRNTNIIKVDIFHASVELLILSSQILQFSFLALNPS